MKFGETLRQRSIPQWSYYNVDYNGLKHLIKDRTTNIRTNPVTIPGQGPSSDAWTQLEAEIFPILWQQHDRVSLFITSKYGEIKRRLDQVERQLKRLTQQRTGETRNSPPVQQTRKYAKLVRDTESISEDIQSFSQFANTQRLAFKKILKKYRKWTGSASLQARVNKEILSQPESLLKPDLSHFLERLSKVTSALRCMVVSTRRNQPGHTSAEHGTSGTRRQSSVATLHEAAAQESPLKFDAAFLSMPLGNAAGRAAYWIHPDNVSEAEVLLLRYMQHRDPTEQKGPSSPRRTHTAMCDNLQRYVQDQGATTVAQIEEVEGSFASKVALNILWAEEADAVVIASDLSPITTKSNPQRRTMLVKRTDLPSCLSHNGSSYRNSGPESDSQPSQEGNTELREFMAQHRDVKPLAEIHSVKDRFAGINNTIDVGVWAVLDQDIVMSPPDLLNIGATLATSTGSSCTSKTSQGKAFPYAVLQVRWEFSRVPEIVRALDHSHLAERVRGFALETEAVYSILSPQEMPKPLWQPLLGRDIRKLPPLKMKRSLPRNKDGSSSPEEPLPLPSATSSNGDPSDSVFSTNQAQSSATSIMGSVRNTTEPDSPDSTRLVFDQRNSPKQKKRVRLPSPSQPEMVYRYWNEFDDGSEYGEDSSYAIYVNPDEPTNFPGTETLSRALAALQSGLSHGARKMRSWLPSAARGFTARERAPLLAGQRIGQYLEDSSDSEGIAGATDKSRQRSSDACAEPIIRSSSTLRQHELRECRETFLFRTYVAAFLLSYSMLVISAILQGTSRRKVSFKVGTGVIIGVVIALFCGVGGVGLMMSRRDPLSLLHRTAVVLAFCLVCAGGGCLLALVGSTGIRGVMRKEQDWISIDGKDGPDRAEPLLFALGTPSLHRYIPQALIITHMPPHVKSSCMGPPNIEELMLLDPVESSQTPSVARHGGCIHRGGRTSRLSGSSGSRSSAGAYALSQSLRLGRGNEALCPWPEAGIGPTREKRLLRHANRAYASVLPVPGSFPFSIACLHGLIKATDAGTFCLQPPASSAWHAKDRYSILIAQGEPLGSVISDSANLPVESPEVVAMCPARTG